MEDLLKSLKNKLRIDKDKVKEQTKAQEAANKNDDVRATLEKVDNDHMVDADEVAQKLTELSASAKMAAAAADDQKSKVSPFNIFSKNKQDNIDDDDEDTLIIQDDVSFLD